MKKIIQFSPNANRFFLENCQFPPLLNVHFINITGNPLLMGLSKTRLFAENVLYYCLMAKNKLKKVANESLAKSLEKRKAKKTPEFKKVFNFDSLVRKLHQLIESFPDPRTGKNLSKSMKDAALGAFSIFFTQSPSFLSYQTSMQETEGKNNAATLFGINEILSDNHIRNLLDEVHPSYIFPLFNFILDGLNDCGMLDELRSFNNNLLIALDGAQYYSSSSIHCDNCSQTNHKNGSTIYSHSAVLAAIVKPGSNKAISLIPEYITPQDGHEKQDCETAAAKRWLRAYGPRLKQLGVTITGMDEKYKLIRKTLPTRKTFFQDIRALTRYICFDSWNQLMIFMLRGLKLKIPIEQEPEVIDTS
jgi:hypothetical protein